MIKMKYFQPAYHLLISIFILCCLITLNACKDLNPSMDQQGFQQEAPPQIQQNGAGNLAVHRSEDPFIRRANKHFIHLAEEIPEFAGIYLENKATRIVIGLTQPEQVDKASVKQYIRNYFGKEASIIGSAAEGGVDAIEITFQDAKYTYFQLQQWRNKINNPVLDLEGVTFTSLSQSNNKIRIGITEKRFERQIQELIGKNNVPEEAVKISVTGPVQADVNMVNSSYQVQPTLRDMYRPLVGGLEISLYENGTSYTGTCTYGFNVYWQTEKHWLTNSHCTRERWTVHPGDEYYQSNIFDGSSAFVGSEVYDPYGWDCGSRDCRYSDAALIELPATQTWNFAEIARTEYSSGPGGGAGSLVIDATNPRFVIIDKADAGDFLRDSG